MRVDLNADMGEGFGPWRMGDDAALLGVVTSANIACGMHAGDANVMAGVMRAAAAQDVGIGAHPGFADLQGFGRRRLKLSAEELANLVAYQLGAAQGMARLAGTRVRHLKLHGALSNMAAEDAAIARACYGAAQALDPEIILVAQAATAMEAVAREMGANWVGEIFADRAYNDDGTLLDRSRPGAVLHDPAEVGRRMEEMIRAGAIITASGARLPARIDTICVHGDSPAAVAMAGSLRAHLETAGIAVTRF
ncbi:LamB/YcsF family protein [Sinirhodobacter huangdaonensis]|uniref:5-oxoprolinase subunit A n=1 Tax=Paenirhodobacter huangdaonensis TaxID=2501515 RepID=A0A3S3L8B8_9RHOB|nr:5-oxoprolinase subunit PxpA [Sinirhodobacter huangdaonensis]RWR47199.1 5-oxoprolinase subunit PxpA [Sinirhodobacter huangdaonensis]